jgi:hypothetical protein
MTTEFTNYVVRTKYEVHGAPDAARKVDEVGRAADRSARSAGGLKASLMSAFAMAGGAGAIMLAKRSLVDFNATLEGNKSTMAGLLMMNTGGGWEKNQEKSNALVDRFLIRAKETSATMADLALMGQWVTASVTAAGGSMKTLENITVGAAVAGKALGRETGDAGREISQMIGGRVEAVDVFGRQLLRSIGDADYQQFNKLKESQRLKLTEQALNQPALRAMAKAQSNQYAGVMSTLQDNLQITLGKVGLPLMKEITEEVKLWNSWIEKHPEKIAEMVRDVGSALKSGFGAVKSAVTWIADNKEVLLSLAKAALVMKGGSLIAGTLGAPFTALANLTGSMTMASNSTKGFAGAMTGVVGRLAQFGTILGTVGAGASFIADGILRGRDRALKQVVDTSSTADFFGGLSTGQYRRPGDKGMDSRVDDAIAAGILMRERDGRWGVNATKFMLGEEGSGIFKNATRQERSQMRIAATNELLAAALDRSTRAYAAGLSAGGVAIGELWRAQIERVTKAATEFDKPLAKSGTTIKIDKVVVPAKDPDRWIHDFEKETLKRARVPRRPRAALRGGGAL